LCAWLSVGTASIDHALLASVSGAKSSAHDTRLLEFADRILYIHRNGRAFGAALADNGL
jgi:hypothetical protein